MNPTGSNVLEKWGSKRSNNNEKGGQQDRKSRRKMVQIASKVSNDRFLWKNRLTLGQLSLKSNVIETNQFFSAEREGQ